MECWRAKQKRVTQASVPKGKILTFCTETTVEGRKADMKVGGGQAQRKISGYLWGPDGERGAEGKDTVTEQPNQDRTKSAQERHRELWAWDLYVERNAQEGQLLPLTGAPGNT